MRITTAKADNDCLKLHNSWRIVCISNSRSSSSSSRKNAVISVGLVNSSRAQPQRSVSIGSRISYSVGAWMMMPKVPTRQAAVNIHRNIRSRTIATNCQSCFTCVHRSLWEYLHAGLLTMKK